MEYNISNRTGLLAYLIVQYSYVQFEYSESCYVYLHYEILTFLRRNGIGDWAYVRCIGRRTVTNHLAGLDCIFARLQEYLREFPHFGVGVVQRRRGNSHNIWLPLVNNHPVLLQLMQDMI